jgi:hypothetical protein
MATMPEPATLLMLVGERDTAGDEGQDKDCSQAKADHSKLGPTNNTTPSITCRLQRPTYRSTPREGRRGYLQFQFHDDYWVTHTDGYVHHR